MDTSDTSIKHKVALVTGGSRGIGRAIVERLAKDGAKVAFTYVANEGAARDVAEGIAREGGEALAIRADMKDLAQVRSMFDEVTQRFGRLDVLVNNAAGTNVFKPTALLSVEEYDSMFLITRGVYFSLQEAAKRIADGGRIINVSTGGTAMPMAGGGAYIGSKGAIEHFSMALAKELGARQVTVNTVRPGVTETDGLVLDAGSIAHLIQQTPMGRLGKPADIAAAVALLASDDAHWITGQNVAASGGIV
jgi:3-oxoacyl-[acyl-carrier protein] reductase